MSNNLEPVPILSTSNNAEQQKPGENDVILGIGCNKHCGNVKFRQFIKAYKRARFQTNTKLAASEAVKEVAVFWRNMSPRGRFLAQSKTDGEWHEVDEKQAMRIASFFLMDQNQKGQKATEAKKDQQLKQARSIFGGQSSIANPNIEPVPISAVSSASNNSNTVSAAASSSMGWTQQQQQTQAPQQVSSFASMPNKPVQQQHQDLWSSDDFNPLPLKGFSDDDFDPLPTSYPYYKNNSCSSYPSKSQTLPHDSIYLNKLHQQQQQPQLYGSTPEQLQVSVNMVVNTMPQGYSMGESGVSGGGVNTVTNIQIGTINDQPSLQNQGSSNDYYNNPSNNFQLMTDTGNGYIQISTQNNASSSDYSYGTGVMQSTNYNDNFNQTSQNNGFNDFQNACYGANNGNNYDNFNNNSISCSYGSDMSNNNAIVTNKMSNDGGGMMMMMQNNNNVNNGMMMMMPNMQGSNGMNVNPNQANRTASTNTAYVVESADNSDRRWNKTTVANSVPCAADLLGNFDDW